MSRSPQPPSPDSRRPQDDAVAVVSAYGAYRVLVILLAIWTFFAGLALMTQGVTAISFGGEDAGAERVIGAHMLILVPIYVLLAWKRSEYRRLVWLPYAAQLAVILPTAWALLANGGGFDDGVLVMMISSVFFALFVYVSLSSHPVDFFRGDAGEEPDEYDEDEYEEGEYEDDDVADDEEAEAADEPEVDARGRRYRRTR